MAKEEVQKVNRLTNLEIVEVSFVDKPAAPESRVELFKRDSSGDEEDVKKAVHPPTIPHRTSHLKGQPGSEDVLVEEVSGSKKKRKKKKKPADDDQMVVKEGEPSYSSGDRIKKEVRQMPDDDAPELDFNEEQEEYVRSLEDKAMDLEDAVTKANATITELEKDADDSDTDEEKILKAAQPEVVELVKAAQAEAQEAHELAKSERAKRIRKEMETKADEYSSLTIEKSEMADFLVNAGEHLPDEDVDRLHTMLAAANEAAAVGKLLEEVGSGGDGPTDAEDKIDKAAKVILAKSDDITYEQAYTQAMDENPDLYGDVLDEERSRS